MKNSALSRRVVLILLLISLLSSMMVAVLLLAGCQSTNGNAQDPNTSNPAPSTSSFFPNLDSLGSEKINQVKKAYIQERLSFGYPADMTVDDVFISKYYGCYNDCIVVLLTDRFTGYTAEVIDETIAGVTITYGSSNTIVAYKDGSFYSLQEAHTAGYLTTANIEQIRDIHHAPA